MSSSLNVGDGEMDYVKNDENKRAFVNAWKAITFTNNWEFIRDNNIYNVLNDKRVNEIYDMMIYLGYKEHSGFSFRLTLQAMRQLALHGEDYFKIHFGNT